MANNEKFELLSEHRCFNGTQRFYQHQSEQIGLPMRFSVFIPPQAASGPVPALIYLAGLTCTEETFMIKAGAQRVAAELGLLLIAPDTSPRGANVPGEDDGWDFGTGAGFYLDATEPGWKDHYRMYSYITKEVTGLVSEFGGDPARCGIFGHSMGGHGALTIALKNRDLFRSVSAFAPISAPMQCPWGDKAFSGYLGADRNTWENYDASRLMEKSQAPFPDGILVDQGLADKFLADGQLLPEQLEAACAKANQPLTLRRHEQYDHGYYFISTFMEDHLRFHAERLA